MVEYKFSDVLFSARSPYQQIQIVDTPDFGRFLILDEMANLAESDTVNYTHSLMNIPTESYKVSDNGTIYQTKQFILIFNFRVKKFLFLAAVTVG